MARFLLATFDGGGNVNPFLALTAQLRARGHEVQAIASAGLEPRFTDAGAVFTAVPHGWDGSGWVADVLDEIERSQPDTAAVDFMLPHALCAVAHAEVPAAAVVHILYQGAAVTLQHTTDLASLTEERRRLGLDPVNSQPQILDEADVVLVATLPEFEGAIDGLPKNVRYVGPLLEDAGPDAGWQPPPGDDPLIAVALGTTSGLDEEPVLQRVLDAVAPLPARVFVTVGAHLQASAFTGPPNAVVSGYVRHAAVLPYARLFVTHAGHGGVMAALAAGVPMVCIPLGRDQPLNATRVDEIGAGRSIGRDADVGEVRSAIADVLADARVNEVAQAMARATERERSKQLAVKELERLIDSR